MMNRFAVFAAALLLACGAASAQLLPGGTDADPEKLRATEALGLRIYRHDRAAALATDALLSKRKFRKEKRLGGWLTEARDGGVLVSFIDASSADAPLVRYQVSVPDGDARRLEPEVLDPPQALAPSQQQAWTARMTTLKSRFEACSPRYNTVVLPSDSGEPGWSVFLLPASTKTGEFPFGGAHRLEISGDGTAIAHSRKYTTTCITFTRPPKMKDHTANSVGTTHLLDPAPTELHVWLQLTIGLPLAVATAPNRSLWFVEDGRIRYVQKLQDDGSPAEDAGSSTTDPAD